MKNTGRVTVRIAIMLPPLLLACANTVMQRLNDDPGARERLEALTDEEYATVSRGTDELRLLTAVWAGPDLEYYSCWLEGLEAERSGDLEAAVGSYREASRIERYEMDNFAVLLPLGRTLLRGGQADEANRVLEEFVRRARADLVADGPWGYTGEGAAALGESIAFAEWLLGYLRDDQPGSGAARPGRLGPRRSGMMPAIGRSV